MSAKPVADSDAGEQQATGLKKYYKMCLGLFKKEKKEKRDWRSSRKKEEDEAEALRQLKLSEEAAVVVEAEEKAAKLRDEELEENKEETSEIDKSAIVVQCLVRKFMARVHRRQRLRMAISAAEGFATDEVAQRKERKRQVYARKTGMEAHVNFVLTYVDDLLTGSSVFLVQSVACVTIQKNWRGHHLRLRLYLMRPRYRKPRPIVSRVTPQQARRVWARTQYRPAGGWPGQTATFIEYDINEHVDVPPAGRDFGLKTAKVKAPEATGNRHKRQIVLKDPGAWVGIPVNVEPESVLVRRALERNKKIMQVSL